MADARFYAGARGRRYVYKKDADVECPYAAELDKDEKPLIGEVGGLLWAHAEDSDTYEPFDIARVMRKAHRTAARLRDEADPKLCAQCGAELRSTGYRTWIEARLDDPILDGKINDATRRINERLGGGWLIVPDSVRWWERKREGIAWAREEAAIDRAAETA